MKEVLTIAGSDSGGGAGIQADLKTFAALGLHGLSVITALTAQNSQGVRGIMEVPGSFIESQLEAVMTDFNVSSVKTGMLANSNVIKSVARKIKEFNITSIIVDPVMVAKSGDPLLQREAVQALQEELLPLSLAVTPNLEEAEVLSGIKITGDKDLERAAIKIKEFGMKMVIIKGGHLREESRVAVDTLYDGKEFFRFEAPRYETKNTHGTGCTFSAALASYLALDYSFLEAVKKSKEFITLAIKDSYKAGQGYGPVNPMAGLYQEKERYRVLKNLQEGLKILKEACLAPLIPEVQSSLVMALPRAREKSEVAGFPGRIIKVGEEIRILEGPDFNCSRWMSKVVLALLYNGYNWTSALNLKAKEDVLEACKRAGLTMESFNREEEPLDFSQEEIEWGTDHVLKTKGYTPDIIFDGGCCGMEAMVRVMGKDALDVSRKAAAIAREYQKIRKNNR
ncbi:MAG: bifunctional hydroxymethylpyrimidine kinase/phosphomethylpyrimidine kinase [Candidatus Syntrophonatronum acetioxidans]|uniref:Hydroxymethylpyrimidine/phosphomethylpyrimidine kinase n=1 Tax=Candidatus Syntrophonatronum acetioxidans TaxID=1795816 RepID=A0A424YHX2_9FIRM|nr:MAG: bifunctional hydroxymethylpyrimidine kinase/phosphomethylpyrimidine kinase [Candidatus Syntrophonatronum acetioxidans]